MDPFGVSYIPIPEVDYHQSYRTLAQVQSVCVAYMEEHEKPCAVVTMDDKVCYAFMELDGTSGPVQCFIRADVLGEK